MHIIVTVIDAPQRTTRLIRRGRSMRSRQQAMVYPFVLIVVVTAIPFITSFHECSQLGSVPDWSGWSGAVGSGRRRERIALIECGIECGWQSNQRLVIETENVVTWQLPVGLTCLVGGGSGWRHLFILIYVAIIDLAALLNNNFVEHKLGVHLFECTIQCLTCLCKQTQQKWWIRWINGKGACKIRARLIVVCLRSCCGRTGIVLLRLDWCPIWSGLDTNAISFQVHSSRTPPFPTGPSDWGFGCALTDVHLWLALGPTSNKLIS